MFKSIWPDMVFAANLKPSETFLAKYEINSINTNKGNKPKGQPDGTNKEKNFKSCIKNPNKVAPITTVKLIENVKIKWELGAKLYGIIPTKLFINMYINIENINGKNIWPLFAFIWFITILYIVEYIDSRDNDHALGIVIV